MFTGSGFCDAENTGNYLWPETARGSTASLPCSPSVSGDVSRMATRECDSTGNWNDPVLSECICEAEETITVFGDYSWPETSSGSETVRLPCALGASMEGGVAQRVCTMAMWEDPDFSQCNDEFDVLLENVSSSAESACTSVKT